MIFCYIETLLMFVRSLLVSEIVCHRNYCSIVKKLSQLQQMRAGRVLYVYKLRTILVTAYYAGIIP